MADLLLIPVKQLKGVGARVAERLAKIGIHSAADLLWHLPMRYQDRSRITPIRQLQVGEYAMVEANVVSCQLQYGRKRSFVCNLEDGSGHLQLRFFYFNATQQQQFSLDHMKVRCFGLVSITRQGLSMVHPEYQLFREGEDLPLEKFYTPIYPTTEGVKQGLWRKLFSQILPRLEHAVGLSDFIPESILKQKNLPSLVEALRVVHQPSVSENFTELNFFRHPAQRRLALEELLAHQLSLQDASKKWEGGQSISLMQDNELKNAFLNQLPFELTGAQKRVVQEIENDMGLQTPMLRLVQGDVGSGKTVIAAIAALSALANDKQVAMMAPTELLAEQHYQNFKLWLESLGYSVALLTGSLRKKEREETLEKIQSGEAKVIIGTHALIQQSVEYQQLGLVIIDEQHRFGVHQRLQLREKNHQITPHQLIMTATPIPRTLAMTLFADLAVSTIDERPPGRIPIKTVAIANNRRDQVIQRIREVCRDGRQAYWICTLVTESEALDCQSAEETHQTLIELLPELKIGLVHGRMKAEQKEKTLNAFRQAEYDLLVATTVVEVGVDVPNASLMIIENPERLGLSQLHQLRGRVGRGTNDSYCVLLYQAPLSEYAKQRVDIMRQSDDGFVIAQKDLELRGPGEVLGTRQAGVIALRVADLARDQDLLPVVHQLASDLQTSSPQAIESIIHRWLGSKSQFAVV